MNFTDGSTLNLPSYAQQNNRHKAMDSLAHHFGIASFFAFQVYCKHITLNLKLLLLSSSTKASSSFNLAFINCIFVLKILKHLVLLWVNLVNLSKS